MSDVIKFLRGIGSQIIKYGEEYWQIAIIGIIVIIGYVLYKWLL